MEDGEAVDAGRLELALGQDVRTEREDLQRGRGDVRRRRGGGGGAGGQGRGRGSIGVEDGEAVDAR